MHRIADGLADAVQCCLPTYAGHTDGRQKGSSKASSVILAIYLTHTDNLTLRPFVHVFVSLSVHDMQMGPVWLIDATLCFRVFLRDTFSVVSFSVFPCVPTIASLLRFSVDPLIR